MRKNKTETDTPVSINGDEMEHLYISGNREPAMCYSLQLQYNFCMTQKRTQRHRKFIIKVCRVEVTMKAGFRLKRVQ